MRKPLTNFAFIDGQNFYKSVRALELELEALEVKLDLQELRTYLEEKHGVRVAYYFIGYIPTNEGLYRQLRRQGYELKFKEVATHEDEIKGNVDVNLTLQTMLDYDNYTKAVLVTSDGDYACLLKHLQSVGKLECLVASSRKGCSRLLRKLHKWIEIYYLDDIMRDLYIRKETS
jgi:uncharacterized LabA/DUF88 family protein